MRRFLLSAFALCCLGLGSAGAQEKIKAPAGAPAPVILVEPGCAKGCEAACCTKKVCVPETTTKKITKTVYGSKCKDFCLKGCVFNFPRLFHRNCDACGSSTPCVDCEKCGKVRTKRVLLKKKIDCGEECETKCKVVEEPAVCAPACGPTCNTGLLNLHRRSAHTPACETIVLPAHPTPVPAKVMPPATSQAPVTGSPSLTYAPLPVPPAIVVVPQR